MLHSLASTYGQRPSHWLGLAPESWEAYQLDVATLELGRWVEGRLSETDKQGRAKHSLDALLAGEQGQKAAPREQFRSFAGMPMRSVRIDASGIWADEEPVIVAGAEDAGA